MIVFDSNDLNSNYFWLVKAQIILLIIAFKYHPVITTHINCKQTCLKVFPLKDDIVVEDRKESAID